MSGLRKIDKEWIYYLTTSPSIVNHSLETFQFDTSNGGREPPINLNNFRITLTGSSHLLTPLPT
jgi:hypothetical protein